MFGSVVITDSPLNCTSRALEFLQLILVASATTQSKTPTILYYSAPCKIWSPIQLLHLLNVQDLTTAPPIDWISTLIKQSEKTHIYPTPLASLDCYGLRILWINRNNNHFNHTINIRITDKLCKTLLSFTLWYQANALEFPLPLTYLDPFLLAVSN